MKVIRKEREKLLSYQWDGKDAEAFIDIVNSELGIGAEHLSRGNVIIVYLDGFTTITLKPTDFLLWGQYSGFSKVSEQEFKEQYEVWDELRHYTNDIKRCNFVCSATKR